MPILGWGHPDSANLCRGASRFCLRKSKSLHHQPHPQKCFLTGPLLGLRYLYYCIPKNRIQLNTSKSDVLQSVVCKLLDIILLTKKICQLRTSDLQYICTLRLSCSGRCRRWQGRCHPFSPNKEQVSILFFLNNEDVFIEIIYDFKLYLLCQMLQMWISVFFFY